MKFTGRSLYEWMNVVNAHEVVLPIFQRHEAWSNVQIKGLLENVLHNLPAGTVLVLEVGESPPFRSRPIEGVPPTKGKATEHLLDGQQRITALWRSLHDSYEDRTYFVVVRDDKNPDELPRIESFKRKESWINKPGDIWRKGMIPLHVLSPDNEGGFSEWVKSVGNNEIWEYGTELRLKFSSFDIPVLSLPKSTPKEVALDVFIQMNTSYSRLTAYDITVAQVAKDTEKSFHEMVDQLQQEVPTVGAYMDPEKLVLPVAALLMDKTPSMKTFLTKDFYDNITDTWDKTVKGIKKAITFLEEESIFDGKRIPTDVALYPLSALWANVDDDADSEGNARIILRRYLWRAFCAERYEKGTTHSKALTDYRQMLKLLENKSSNNLEIFDDVESPLPSEDDLKSAAWPKRKDRLARAILAVSLRSGGIDFADGKKVSSKDDLAGREYHHIFPREWLENKKHTNINLALNCALVGWKINRKMSSKPPSKYIDERMQKSVHGEEEIRSRLDSHLISFDKIQKENYEEFLSDRAERILSEMKKLCG